MNGILLLNANMTPLQTIPLKRAVSLLSKGAVDVIEAFPDKFLRSAHTSQPFPAVLRLRYFVNVPKRKAIWSRRAVFSRDGYKCVYCNAQLTRETATLDHVIPRIACEKAGIRPSSFGNTVCCCQRCNAIKADRTMRDAGLRFYDENYIPRIPRVNYLVLSGDIPDSWRIYLNTTV